VQFADLKLEKENLNSQNSLSTKALHFKGEMTKIDWGQEIIHSVLHKTPASDDHHTQHSTCYSPFFEGLVTAIHLTNINLRSILRNLRSLPRLYHGTKRVLG